MSSLKPFAALFLTGILALSASAQEARVGRETHLPIPRYVSIDQDEANLRRGPSTDYPIDWVYHREGIPVRIIAESGNWRKIEDFDGEKGWLHHALLSGRRTVIITAEKISLNKAPTENANLVAILEQNVIANLKSCSANWCEIEIDNHDGWVPKTAIWGADPDEVFDE